MTRALRCLAILATFGAATLPALGQPSIAPAIDRTRLAQPASDTLHALFIGNSFTYYNDMPRMVEAMSTGTGRRPIRTRMVATGGASLEDNWADSLVQQALHSRRWDWVVVNDQSTFNETYLVNGQSRVHGWAELEHNAPLFDSAARAAGARLAIIMHWPDRDAPTRDADALAYAFTTVAHRLHATLIPIEPVWQSVRHAEPTIELYDSDRHHPSPAGSFLLASVVYATLTGNAPGPGPDTVRGSAVEKSEGLTFPDSIVVLAALSPATVATLQHAAWRGHQLLASHHGYPSVTPPAPIALPALAPPGARLTTGDLVGTWHGQLHFYPQPVTLTLEIRDTGSGLAGTLHLLLGGAAARAKDDSVSVAVGDDGSLFTMRDPAGPNHSVVVYRARYLRGALDGVAVAESADTTLRIFGTWTLHHDH